MRKLDQLKGIRKSKMNRADHIRRVLRANGARTPEEMRETIGKLLGEEKSGENDK